MFIIEPILRLKREVENRFLKINQDKKLNVASNMPYLNASKLRNWHTNKINGGPLQSVQKQIEKSLAVTNEENTNREQERVRQIEQNARQIA